jgi:CubicO group peptidase (beta-lactamase class C family)/peptidoglycan/LPS O-acetylase OafA/YrhL
MFGVMNRVTTEPDTEAPPDGSTSRRRDPLLDLLRSIALARIVAWHLYAQTWLTWIAAVPVMFFVAGSLLSPGRHSYRSLVTKRARRLLVPFWVYGAAVGVFTTIVAVGSSTTHDVSLTSIWSWIVPIVDPTSATWTSGWLSTHLWYLRAYLWIVVLSPLLVRAARRIVFTLATVGVLVVGLELAMRFHVPVLESRTFHVLVGDALVYGCFATVGMWHRNNKTNTSVRARIFLSFALLGSAIAFAKIVGLPEGGVNASYPAIMLLGLGTLFGLSVVEGPLRRFADRASVASATKRISSRALTIYLWHPACIIAASALIGFDGVLGATTLALLTTLLIGATVLLLGWVEDSAGTTRDNGSIGAKRSGRIGVLATTATVIVAAAIPVVRSSWVSAAAVRTVNSGSLVANVPAPSARLALSNSAFPRLIVRPATTTTPPTAIPAQAEEPLFFAAPLPATIPSPPPVRATPPSLRRAKPATVTATKPTTTRPPSTVPSTRPASTTSVPTAVLTRTITATTTPTQPAALPADKLQAAFDEWRKQAQPAITSSIVSVRIGTRTWTARSADPGVDSKYQPTTPFMASSITKTFTAALIMRAVDRGALKLDEQVPALTGLSVPVPPGITPRMLLTHTSGLVDYRNAPGYDATMPLTALDAVTLSLKAPLATQPGTQMTYGNSNYLYLGLLLEQIEGRPYAQLVRELTTSLGLADTRLDETPRPGWIGFSSGGIVATAADLASWGQALLTPGKVLSDRALATMTTIGDVNLGLGLWPACPCSTDAAGVKRSTAIGHHTADGGMFVFPGSGMTVVAMFEPIGHDTDGRIVSLAAALNAAML